MIFKEYILPWKNTSRQKFSDRKKDKRNKFKEKVISGLKPMTATLSRFTLKDLGLNLNHNLPSLPSTKTLSARHI